VRQCLSPPSAVQRETNIIPIDPIAPVDMFSRTQKGYLEAEKHASPSRHIPRRQKRFSSYPSIISHFIDDELPCLKKATREQVWKDAITEEYKYILRSSMQLMEVSRNTKRNL
jgi:hypothetical protein